MKIAQGLVYMAALEAFLKEAKATKGTWHKTIINNAREYIAHEPEPEVISAINKIQDGTLLPLLWEVGISQILQDVANRRSMKLAGTGV